MASKSSAIVRNVANLRGLRYRLVDARGEVLGRLASRIAVALQGKDKPTYAPGAGSGDVVVVVNAGEVHLTGEKLKKKRSSSARAMARRTRAILAAAARLRLQTAGAAFTADSSIGCDAV